MVASEKLGVAIPVPVAKESASSNGADAAAAATETPSAAAAAWASTARCYLDLARFTSRCDEIADAGEHARTALELAQRAHGEVCVAVILTSRLYIYFFVYFDPEKSCCDGIADAGEHAHTALELAQRAHGEVCVAVLPF